MLHLIMSKGRVLYLHRFAQRLSIFYAKTSALRKRLIKLGYTPVYLNAPLKLTPAQFPSSDALSKFSTVVATEDEETLYRAWWIRPSTESNAVELDEAIDTIRKYVKDGEIIPDLPEMQNKQDSSENPKSDNDTSQPPIVGLIGFSQGAGFAGLLARKFKKLFEVENDLEFVIVYSGFLVDDPKQKDYYAPGQDAFKMLHVIGELDTLVDEERAMKLYKPYEAVSDVLKHPGGHFVPNSKLLIDQVVNWLQNPRASETAKESKEDTVDDLLDMMEGFGKV